MRQLIKCYRSIPAIATATIVVLGLAMATSVMAATGICPSVKNIPYASGKITAPAGWWVSATPECPNNTPTGWIETGWQSLAGFPDISRKITCSYQVAGNNPQRGCGAWSITRDVDSTDPWKMENRPTGWTDFNSHKKGDSPVSDCETNRESCFFPLK